MEHTKEKRHYFLKFLIVLVVFIGILFYAYKFPSTMKLFDKHINKMIEITGMEYEFTAFADFSAFSKKAVNEISYWTEVIKNNTEGVFENVKPISSFIINCGAKFPLESKNIISFFGERVDPISGTESFHSGIDAAVPLGSEIYAAWPGNVIETGFDSVYGNYIIIEHSEDFFTKYCHLLEIIVSTGDFVKVESVIGKAGSTGRSTGSHLHFEVEIDGHKIDPMECFDI